MRLGRPWKIALGLLSVLPVLGLPTVAIIAVLTMQGTGGELQPILDHHPRTFAVFVGIAALLLLQNYAMMFFLIIHVAYNRGLKPGWKAFWIVALLLFNVVAYPVYWLRQIWQDGQSPPLGRGGRWAALAFALFCVAWFVAIVVYMAAVEPASPPKPVMLVWAGVFDLVYFPLLIATIVTIVRAPWLDRGRKAAWLAVVVGVCLFGLPIFWSAELRRARRQAALSPETPAGGLSLGR